MHLIAYCENIVGCIKKNSIQNTGRKTSVYFLSTGVWQNKGKTCQILPYIIYILYCRIVFGMTKDTFRHVLALVASDLECHRENMPAALRPPQKLAIFLDFARTNGYHRSVSTAEFNRISQSHATRIINHVARSIAGLRERVSKIQFRIGSSQ